VKTGTFLLLAFLAVPAAAGAQQGPPRGGPPSAEQRAELEARVVQRFIQQTSAELALNPETATRLEQVFREAMTERRQLARSAADLRGRLQRSVGNPATTDAQFARLLDELEAVRLREHEVMQREQGRLAELLTPRQRAILAMNWLRMQDNMRELMSRREGPHGGTTRH
jgi:Spy/CpxP family protein refolding chaperone